MNQRNKNSLIFQFLNAQLDEPKKNDWGTQVLKDLKEIDFDLSQIEQITTKKFKEIVKVKTEVNAFEYLTNKKDSHEKVRHIKYESLKMQSYLKSNDLNISIRDRQFLFQCRVNDIDLRTNRTWKYEETHCISCKDKNQPETGAHILECKVLNDKNDKISYIPAFNDLYSDEIEEQIYASHIIGENMKIRDSLKSQA